MRVMTAVVLMLSVLAPAAAGAQSRFVFGSAGPLFRDSGHSVSAGFGVSPASSLMLLFDLERTHLPTTVTTDGPVISTTRGGTTTLAAAELRVLALGRRRVSPYGLLGFGAGVSRPNVNATFPNRVTHRVRGPFFGGGLHVPLAERLDAFADLRVNLVIGDDPDGLNAFVPIRMGVAWRF